MIGAKAKAEHGAMAKPPKARSIDHDLIRELAKLLDETGLTEIEIEQDGQRVRVARSATRRRAVARAAPAMPPPPVAMPIAAPADPAKHPGVVTSPMVGTAYRRRRSPAPSRSSRSAAR